MRKMEVADAVPIQMVMPTPPASEQEEPYTPTASNQSPAETPAEAGLDKKYKVEPRRLPKLDLKPIRKEDDLEYKQQLLEVTALPSRDTVYNQAKQLFGLRHKPITQQDALPNSEVPAKISARAGPVASLPRHPLCHPVKAYYRSTAFTKTNAIAIDFHTTTQPNLIFHLNFFSLSFSSITLDKGS
ncbi:hypothetical protein GQ457_01G019490 [Hibiscus cannabinus]